MGKTQSGSRSPVGQPKLVVSRDEASAKIKTQVAKGQQLFDWIDGNGPAPNIEPNIASIEVIETVAVVRLEVKHWSGHLAGADARMSDVFTLLKTDAGWKISQKTFHWHAS